VRKQLWTLTLGAIFALTIAAALPGSASADATPDTATRDFSGAITARAADLISVGTDVFAVTPATVWTYRNEPVTDLGMFDVGDLVVVAAQPSGSGWQAARVMLMANVVPDGGSDSSDQGQPPDSGEPPAVFNGPIQAITAGALTVEATVLDLTSGTKWISDGRPTTDIRQFAVGDQVAVTADYDGQAWTAESVELTGSTGTKQPAPTPAPPASQPTVQTFSGAVKSVSSSALDVGETTFQLNSATQWLNADGTPGLQSSVGVGDTVQVKATQAGANWIAQSVQLIQHSQPMGGNPPPEPSK
jgi:hypothetical protein